MVGGLQPPPLEEEQRAAALASHGVIFVLEGANLEIAKVGKAYQLLDCDNHNNFLRRHGKDPGNHRPDICHQALLTILDSPLNKAGKVKGIYVHTNKNVIIQVSPGVRLPRTYKRFAGLITQLLQKLSIRATNGPDKLLKVVKGPITRLLPVGCRRVGLSHKAKEVVDLRSFIQSLPGGPAVPSSAAAPGASGSSSQEAAGPEASSGSGGVTVFVVGAFAHGQIDHSYTDTLVSVSDYPLSAAYCLSRITNVIESQWGIV